MAICLCGVVPHRDNPNRQHPPRHAWHTRCGLDIPLRADLAADIRSWLTDRLARAQQAARDAEQPIPAALANDEPLFDVPDGLIRIFDATWSSPGWPASRNARRGGGRRQD
ncbi:MAG: hypothetical protein ACK4WH_05820 [Phycisphaerales bacterium]